MSRLKNLIMLMMVVLLCSARDGLPPEAAQSETPPHLTITGTASTLFVNSGQVLGGETGNGVALGDLDGDGDVDAFVANNFSGNEANQIWFNQGNGSFTSGPTLGTDDGNAVALGDLDGDGDLDAVVATLSSISAMVWLNQGGAQEGNAGDFAPGVSLGSFSGYGVALGDVDNDGDLDVLVVGNSNQVWLNNGDATFAAGPALPFLFSEAAVLADLDGDGFVDAVIADSGSGTNNQIFWNDGNWAPGPGSFTAGDLLPTTNLIHGVAVGNLDGDSQPDVFLVGGGEDQIYWNEGSRTFSTPGSLPVSDNSWAIALADVDGDGLLDAVVANITAEPNRLWHNDGGRAFTVTQEFGDELGLYWSRGLALADLNGDGSVDLFDVTTADDRVWFNQSAPSSPGATWQVQTVAQRGDTGLGSSIAIDDAGRPHITYVEFIARPNEGNYRLFYATWDGQLWHTSTVDTAFLMAASTSLALDSQGRPHIAYESNEEGSLDERLRYATWDGNQWQRQTVHPDAESQGHFSLAVDSQDQPYISFYHGLEQRLVYARQDGAQWQLDIVDAAADVGRFNSLAMDRAGNPHIAYHDSTAQELKYATRSGDEPWQVSVVDAAIATGEDASLALDSAGRPHIGYISDGEVRYARYDGTAWQFENVPIDFSAAQRTVLALDANDAPHLIWNIFPTADVRYGRREEGIWRTEVAATAPFWRGHDLAVDASLTPHVAFYHSDYGDLRYAVLAEPWRVQFLDTPGLVERPSLALPVGGFNRAPEISYYKPQTGLLRHAAWEEAMWQLVGVDFISASGAAPSLAIGNDNRPRLSYYDADSRQLRYAVWNGNAWQSEVVDSDAGTGRFSILLLQGVRPDIVYWDDNARRIWLARRSSFTGDWQFTINLAGPPAASGSGFLSAVRLSDGRIAVSYVEAGEGVLRLAIWDGESWSDTVIAGGLNAEAPHNSLAVDAVENELAIAYYQQSSQQIIYAFRQDGIWQSQTAASNVSGLTGLALQLALDSRRQPRLTYAADNALWLASGQAGTWRNELIYQEPDVALNGVSLGLSRRQHVAVGTSDGLLYAYTLAAATGPEPLIRMPPYDPISPFLACFDFLFDNDLSSATVATPALAVDPGSLEDLDVFLRLTPLFRATPGGQFYVDLYGQHVQEMTSIVLDDTDLLQDSFGVLQNFLPGLEALATGRGDEVVVTQELVDDAADIWERLAAAGSPGLANAINTELARTSNLQDFVGMSFADWAEALGVMPLPCNGDVDGNGLVTPADVLLNFQCFLGLSACTPDVLARARSQGDITRDGQFTPADGQCVLRHFLSLSVTPHCQCFLE